MIDMLTIMMFENKKKPPIQNAVYEMMKFAAYALTKPGEKNIRHHMIRVLLKNVIISGGNTQFPGKLLILNT